MVGVPGSEEKLARCRELGAAVAINYKTEDFVERVKEETGGEGKGPRIEGCPNLSSLGRKWSGLKRGGTKGKTTKINYEL